MEVSIKLETDSANSPPSESLLMYKGYNDRIIFQIENPTRTISVCRRDLKKALKALKDDEE